MTLKNYCLFLSIFIYSGIYAKTVSDSLTIVGLKWETTNIQKGIIRKHVQVPLLYNCVQNINIVEMDFRKRHPDTRIVVTHPKRITSDAARSANAIAAINGSYFDVQKGNSVCYLKVGKQVIS